MEQEGGVTCAKGGIRQISLGMLRLFTHTDPKAALRLSSNLCPKYNVLIQEYKESILSVSVNN